MVDKELLEEAMELTKDIPATDLPGAVLTPLLSKEQAEDTSYRVKIEWDILREQSQEKMVKRLNELSWQWREIIGGIVPVSTISGVIFYQLIKRAVAVSDEAENNLDNGTNWENLEEKEE